MPDYINPEEPEWPVTQGFGQFPGGLNPPGGHTGRDKGTPTGRPLRAPADCTVSFEGFPQTMDGSDNPWLLTKGGGLCCVLDTNDGKYVFITAHMNQTIVNKGQRLKQGEIYGYTGNTGLWTTGPHVHTECMPDGWNIRNGTYGRINPDFVLKSFWTGAPVKPTLPNHRLNGPDDANQRSTAVVIGGQGEPGNNIVRVIPANQLETFEGFVHGQEVTRNGFTSDIWFVDKIGAVWSGCFTDNSTTGLPDLTPRPKLEANQRRVGADGAYSRNEPHVDGTAPESVNTNINRVIMGGTVEIFTGFVHGELVTTDAYSSDVWFVDGKGFVWSGAFEDHGVVGLPDLTVVAPPVPVPPAPVPKFPHLNGIDVSTYQESAALNKLPADFYWIKATEGGGDWTDKDLAANVAEARLTGKPIGFYHFARPMATAQNTAAEELRSFLTAIKPYLRKGDAVILDWESENQHRTDWALEWLRGARAAVGGTPILYLNRAALDAYDWTAVKAGGFALWFAGGAIYGDVTEGFRPDMDKPSVNWPEKSFLAWQYTGRGRLPGYAGDLDLNVFYGTVDELLALGATRTLEDPKPNDPIDPPPPADPGTETDLDKLKEFRDWMAQYIDKLSKNEGGTNG